MTEPDATRRHDVDAFARDRGAELSRLAYVLTAGGADQARLAVNHAFSQVGSDPQDDLLLQARRYLFADLGRRTSQGRGVVSAMYVSQPRIAHHELERPLKQLSPQQRGIVGLRHVDGLSDAEIAAVLHQATSSVSAAAQRAEQRLSRSLDRSHGTLDERLTDFASQAPVVQAVDWTLAQRDAEQAVVRKNSVRQTVLTLAVLLVALAIVGYFVLR